MVPQGAGEDLPVAGERLLRSAPGPRDASSRTLAERAEDIDIARAEEAKRRAEARLVQSAKDIDYERARTALVKSLARLQVASRSQFAGRVGRQRMPPPQA